MRISDFKGLFKKSMATIVNVENPYGDYYQVTMKPEVGVTWNPGEHGIFTLPNAQVKGRSFRAFSIASVQEEGVIIIGTRTGKEVSNFKKELITMKEGDLVAVRGPFGWFKIQDSKSPIVMVAGGVGITPIRALLKQLETDCNRSVELVYSSSDYFLFEEQIQEIASGNKMITVYKTQSREETRETIATLVTKYKDDAYYFISGSRPFIGAIKKQIKETGVKGKRIINDPFFGY